MKPPASPLPAAPGTYALVLRMADARTLAIGRLGAAALPAGWYVYVGSAWGPGGLGGRLAHHQRPAHRPHWHIDYLRTAAPLAEIWALPGARCEHVWAAALADAPGAALPVPRFGASDCRCAAHLFLFNAPPAPTLAGLWPTPVHVC